MKNIQTDIYMFLYLFFLVIKIIYIPLTKYHEDLLPCRRKKLKKAAKVMVHTGLYVLLYKIILML